MKVNHEVVKSFDGRIKFRRFSAGGRDHYNLAVWIDGAASELDAIEKVDYMLHPSFSTPIRTSRERKSGFAISIWTWGIFNIEVTVHFKDGSKKVIDHYLTYELPADTGSNYLDVG